MPDLGPPWLGIRKELLRQYEQDRAGWPFCAGRTRRGDRCQAWRCDPSPYCHNHVDQDPQLTLAFVGDEG